MAIFDAVTKKFLCECGCGKEVNFWVELACGHWTRTDEGRKRNSDNNLGRCYLLNEEYPEMCKAQRQKYIDDPTVGDRISESKLNTFYTDGARKNMSEARLREYRDDPTRADRISEALSGRIKEDSTILLSSEAKRRYWASLSTEEKEAKLLPLWKSQHRGKTKTESLLDKWLSKSFPEEWEYTGSGRLWVGSKNPDFTNVSKKAVIELFGNYYHDPVKFPDRLSEEELVRYYEGYGFNCLVVWVDTWEDLVLEWITIKNWIDGQESNGGK